MTRLSQSIISARGQLLKRLGAGLLGLGLICLAGCPSSTDGPADEPPGGEEQPPAAQQPDAGPSAGGQPASAQDVLAAMVDAYKNAATYADSGSVRLLAEQADGKIDQQADFSLTFERPNKLRLHAYQVMVVCDGRQLHAAIADLPGQVLVREAPDKLTLRSVYKDRLLATTLSQGFAGSSLQLMLLLGEDPLRMLLQDTQKVELGEPEKIDEQDCYRVNVTRPDGTLVFWIDQESYVLRRIGYPTEDMRRMLAQGGEVGSVSLVADFPGARLGSPAGGSVDAKAFQFEIPPGAAQVKFFVPPDPAQLLGKKVSGFKFVDLDGNPVAPESLVGKIVVLDLWASWCEPCRRNLPLLNKVYRQFSGNDRVALLAVSVDQPQVENKVLVDAFEQLQVQVPILRDPRQSAAMVFHNTSIPALFLLDASGVLQDYEIGGNPQLDTDLPEKINKLLAGKDIYHEPLDEYNKRLKEYERALETPESELPQGGAAADQRIPQAKIVAASQPKTFKLVPLWRCAELTAPGNIMVVEQPGGAARLLVVDAWKSLAEVGLDGKLIARHGLNVGQMEVVSNLRTAVGADGRRYFAVFASAQQRFHLLDEKLNLLFSFPEDTAENPHQGIADVELADLDGDGEVEAYVGYWGVVGVQRVSLEGKRIWSNRSLSEVIKMAVAQPDPQGNRLLLCTNSTGVLALIDAEGKRRGEVTVDGRLVHWIVAADLLANGRPSWCGLTALRLGENVAVGVSLQGEQLWTHTLPVGVQQQPVEPIVAGRLAPVGSGQWLLPGADGSIRIISPDGQLLDQFNYGAVLGGLATVDLNGRTVLFISSPNGLEAMSVQ